MSEALPPGWAAALLRDVAQFNPRHPKGVDDAMPVSFVPMAAVSESSPDFKSLEDRPLGTVRQGFTHFAEGDVLFAKITPCMENGKGAVATGLRNGLGCGTTELIVLRAFAGIDPNYIYRFLALPSVRAEAKEHFTGAAGQARVPTAFIEALEIPLAPLAEQRRIVARLEQLLGKVAAYQQRLATILILLKRFRQSVLAAACSGRLTADWRDQNECTEDAAALLDRMKVERRDRCSAENGKRKYRDADAVLDDDLPTIPGTWRWTNFDHCSWEITVGHVGPMKDRYVVKGVTFLRCQNVRPLKFDPNGLVCIPLDFHAQLSKSELLGGEILVVRSGANTGDCCVFPRELGEANCSDLVITRPLSGLSAQYGALYVNSPIGQALLSMKETGIAQPHFNIGAMRVKAFPLPPLAEQQEIVRRVEGLFTLADRIEARMAKVQVQAGKLRPSLLAKAFGGELVPTEAELARQEGRDYEPASALLERLQRHRVSDNESEHTRRTHSKASTVARKIKRTARSARRDVMSR